MTIAIKRVYDPPQPSDGFRVLVDRLWPRGLTKEKAALDLWAKDVAPSTELREEFNHQSDKFAEFKKHYRLELSQNPALATFRKELKRPKVTLLFGARDPKINHAAVLAEYLGGAKTKKNPAAKKRPQARDRARSR
ncbi:MAG TPA: DUF488 domain-containing protein [Rhizomicrobium sp.]|jgi:uncharacterized protein YeaO (DUF488 family)|nr:DUF488 domain-containing protein [Rhizomicrobium sp.]